MTPRRLARPVLAALAIACALGASFSAAFARTGSDSTRHVKSIRVGGAGIEIVESNGRPADRVVKIGPGTVTVESDSGTRTVIHGPGIVVDGGESGLVRVFADAEVPAEETIDGDVVAVFGSATLEPGAVIDGDVVALGGALDQANGAIVNGESVSLGLFSWHPGVPTMNVLLFTVLGMWALGFLLGWLLMMLFPQRMQRVALTASHRTAGSFVLGVASAPLVVIAAVLLMVTVVGIPFAIVLPLVYLFAVWAGNLATSYVLGCRLMRRPLAGPMSGAALAAGTLLVTLFFVLGALLAGPQGPLRSLALFFALLGVLLALGLSVVGIGAVLLSRFGSRPRDFGTAPSFEPVPGAMPAAAPAPPAV